ncbi:hypothetical protein C8Q77DRAFT_592019 [Trametes polyzona]|nr:hypothetical protein C8Q77DRAFT_592019 [Trametes polyzona]
MPRHSQDSDSSKSQSTRRSSTSTRPSVSTAATTPDMPPVPLPPPHGPPLFPPPQAPLPPLPHLHVPIHPPPLFPPQMAVPMPPPHVPPVLPQQVPFPRHQPQLPGAPPFPSPDHMRSFLNMHYDSPPASIRSHGSGGAGPASPSGSVRSADAGPSVSVGPSGSRYNAPAGSPSHTTRPGGGAPPSPTDSVLSYASYRSAGPTQQPQAGPSGNVGSTSPSGSTRSGVASPRSPAESFLSYSSHPTSPSLQDQTSEFGFAQAQYRPPAFVPTMGIPYYDPTLSRSGHQSPALASSGAVSLQTSPHRNEHHSPAAPSSGVQSAQVSPTQGASGRYPHDAGGSSSRSNRAGIRSGDLSPLQLDPASGQPLAPTASEPQTSSESRATRVRPRPAAATASRDDPFSGAFPTNPLAPRRGSLTNPRPNEGMQVVTRPRSKSAGNPAPEDFEDSLFEEEEEDSH